jgi:hypothetical protein
MEGKGEKAAQSGDFSALAVPKGRSLAWRFFKVKVADGELGKYEARCSLCAQWISAGKKNSTSNYLAHLRTVHPEDLAKAVRREEAEEASEGQLKLEECMGDGPTIQKCQRQRIVAALIQMIAGDFQPLSIVTDKGFRALVGALDRRALKILPTPKTLRKYLVMEAESVRAKLRSELERYQGLLVVVVDGWSSSTMHSYEAVHVHYIDDNWKLQSRTLGAGTALTATTAASLSSFYGNYLEQFGVKLCNVCGFVSDTAANVRAALQQTKRPAFPCVAHVLNLVVKGALDAKGTTILTQVELVRSIVNHFKHSGKSYKELHEAQSKLKMSEKGVIMDNDTRWSSTYNMLVRFAEEQLPLIEWSRHSDSEAADNLKRVNFRLLEGITALLRPFAEASVLLQAEKLPSISSVWPLMFCILEDLGSHMQKPPQDDNQPIVFISADLEKDLSGAGEDGSKALVDAALPVELAQNDLSLEERECLAQLAEILHDSLDVRWAAMKASHNWTYVCSCAIDPRWKTFRFPRSVMKDVLVQGALYCEKRLCPASPQPIAPPQAGYQPPVDDEDDTSPPKKKRTLGMLERLRQCKGIEAPLAAPPEKTLSQVVAEIQVEAEAYMDLPVAELGDDPLEWWKRHEVKFYHLSKLARFLLCIPATSSSAERDFSATGYFVTDRRSRLKPSLVSDMLLLHGNQDLMSPLFAFPNSDDSDHV